MNTAAALLLATPIEEMFTMWALSPETEGVSCGMGDPVADALCENPFLRSLEPHELAHALGVPLNEAQRGICALAHDVTLNEGARRTFGLSFDEAIARFGKSGPIAKVIYGAPDLSAGAHGDVGRCSCNDAGAVKPIEGTYIGVVDHGAMWEVQYTDGSDEIPKDPNMLDSQAALVDISDPALASRLRTYSRNIRDMGRPMPEPTHGFVFFLVAGILTAGLFLLRGFR